VVGASGPELAQNVIDGLSVGSTYALLALGLAMVFNILNLINFAHGELLAVAGYTMYFGTKHDLPWAIIVLLALGAAILAALVMDRVAFRPLRGSSVATLLLTSFGVSVIIQNLFLILVSPRTQGVTVPDVLNEAVNIGEVSIGVLQILTMACTAVALGLLVLFLRKTQIGIAMRAASEDFSVTRLMGVNANLVIATAFALSGLLAGIAGILYVARRGAVDPTMGFVPVLMAFVSCVIGGWGSLSGAVMGGFALGFIQVALATFLPESVLPWQTAILFALVIAILLVRPGGIVAKRAE
jgi:branched-chain amino acid transport system permease protein